ncbi:MAG: glycosyltransferase family 4 protein [Chitinophagales bacterium]|nr:glycosyltransferase family 4 protein [Chitinophagaceae bacterium]MCB9065065.1 glycosyltransferase family 4 protein [Chitinophagales bacterium]
MNIIIASEVIHPGGAETFILRLAQALHDKGHKVCVFVFYKQLLNYDLCKILAPDVTVIAADIPSATILQKADGLLFRHGIDNSFRNNHIKKSLRKLIRSFKPDVIHSHLLKVDKICLDVTAGNIPVVNTIHGDYLQFWNKTKNNIPIPLLNYQQKAKQNLSRLSGVVCISDKQIAFFNENFPKETENKVVKIYNGYKGNITVQETVIKAELGINEGDFVFGMVSRGIPEKGWRVAIDAFTKLNASNAHLILVGSGDYLKELKAQYQNNKQIHFTGHSDNPINYINIFDVGLLPSTYPSESLPTVIIEYLYCNIPSVASDAGEITNMTGQTINPAGLIVPIKDGKVDETAFSIAMAQYINDKSLYETHKANAKVCYQQFDMDKCVEAYLEVYKKPRE